MAKNFQQGYITKMPIVKEIKELGIDNKELRKALTEVVMQLSLKGWKFTLSLDEGKHDDHEELKLTAWRKKE